MKSIEDIIRESHQGVLRLDSKVSLETQVSIRDVLHAVLMRGSNCTPYVLSLSYRTLPLEDVVGLTCFVKNSPNLIYLDLSNCELTVRSDQNIDVIFKELVDALQIHPALRALDCADVNLSASNLDALATMLEHNKVLLQLSLTGNNGKQDANVWLRVGRIIEKSLQSNQTLLALTLLATPLEESSKKEIREVRTSYKRKLQGNRRIFLSRAEANPKFLLEFNIPDAVSQFSASLEFKDESVDNTTLSVLPLRYIKKAQNDNAVSPAMVSLQTEPRVAAVRTENSEPENDSDAKPKEAVLFK